MSGTETEGPGPETGSTPGLTRWRKRPVVVEAIQWTGANLAEVQQFAGSQFADVPPEDRAEDPERTAEVWDKLHGTWVGVHDGQWVIRGVRGEFYPCDAGVLAETYEPAGSPDPAGDQVPVSRADLAMVVALTRSVVSAGLKAEPAFARLSAAAKVSG